MEVNVTTFDIFLIIEQKGNIFLTLSPYTHKPKQETALFYADFVTKILLLYLIDIHYEICSILIFSETAGPEAETLPQANNFYIRL